ncbi:hypothetical protein [Paraliomyxa miuraensis]|uniref:hypothetical protein n=1 Tax=Paraliomyxa miuraensis TaxID=376150 RepID=UPI00224D99CF|nr:hypothetical protein [Paraliomyxa miuraensis]MCX4244133.1 hypothetical protein [Paraliomyxa miuraensis]
MKRAEPTTFEDRLAVSVKLTINGVAHAFVGGQVPHVELRLDGHGFLGTVELRVQDDKSSGGGFTDELLASFLTADLITAEVSVAAVYHQPETSQSLQPIAVKGLVTHKSVEELLLRRSKDQPILVRRYRLELADPARVLWTQHFPCKLYTNKTPQAIIDEHTGEHITFTYDWSALTKSKPQWFVHLPPEREASFYDFVTWIVDEGGGVLRYDYGQQQYALTAVKDTSSQPQALFGDDVHTAQLVVPPVPRHEVVVADSYADGPRSETVTQDQSVTGVRHDRPMRSPISQDVDDEVTLQRSRLRLPKYEAELHFGRFPTADVVPGTRLTLAAANRWSTGSSLVTPTWRVRELQLCATGRAVPLDHDHQSTDTGYTVSMQARLEQSDDPRVVLPRYRIPWYPAYVEGKVVSEKGEEGEKTYQTKRNATTSLDEYTVAVPLYEDQKVTAPFEPAQGSGNVYVPSYREERVLLAMELESSRIERLLVWRDGAALSMDVQGEHILLGISPTSNTSLSHVYDGKNPVLAILRTHDDDTSLVRMSEGTVLVQVQELQDGNPKSGTLVCTLEKSKTGGVTLKVVNDDGTVTQTVTMDGKQQMELKFVGSSETSYIKIEQDKITLDTKDLVINARNTISCKADATATYESTKDTTIKSSANLVQSATSDVKVSGSNVELTAQSAASMEGMTAKVAGSQSLTLSGTSQAQLSGATVKVSADATLNAESSGMATLGGSMTTIKGSLITAG